jgi:hypothetical protein
VEHSNTYQQFNSTSSSNNSLLSFNVRPLSESILFDRCIYISAIVNFQMVITGVPAGQRVFQYGLTDALQAFPLNRLFTTVQVQLNTASMSINSQDVLPALLRMLPTEVLQKYQNATPTLLDCYLNYSDGVGSNNNVLGGYGISDHNKYLLPRGVHPLETGTSDVNTLISTGTGDSWTLTFSVKLEEPILASPFLWSSETYNNAGLVGVNSFNVICNLDPQMKRFWSKSLPTGTCTLSFTPDAINQAYIKMNFLTTQPTQALPLKNTIPFYDYPRYLLGSAQTAQLNAGASAPYTFSSIQFSVMPNLIYIYVRKPLSDQSCKDAEGFFGIENISINLNSVSGLLSSSTPLDLWKLSARNGLKMNYHEWTGFANRLTNTISGVGPVYGFDLDTIPTCGPILLLNPPRDLSLPPYLSASSLGQFSLSFNITLKNNFSENLRPEIVVICANSGILETMSGQSTYFVGLLNKELCLDAQKEGHPSISEKGVRRMIGGGMHNMAMNAMHKLPLALQHEIKNYARPIISGGVGSGGAKSGGKRPKKLDSYV